MKSVFAEELKEIWEKSDKETRTSMVASGKEAMNLFTKSRIRQDDFVMLLSLCAAILNQIKPEDITNKQYQIISEMAVSAYTIGNRRGKGKTDELGIVKPNKKHRQKTRKKKKKDFMPTE